MAWHTKYLWQSEARRCGKICIRGTRLALTDIMHEAIHGDVDSTPVARVKDAWPYLTEEQIEEALEAAFIVADEARKNPMAVQQAVKGEN